MDFAELPLTSSVNVENSGIVFISRIPPKMTPSLLRQFLSPYGQVGRIFLAPKEIKDKRQVKGKKREFGQLGFEEGWIEFLDKREAKAAAQLLNTNPMGTHKGKPFYDDLWNIKYLPKFKWHHLTDQLAYEKAVKEKKLRNEISQAKKLNQYYLNQAEKAQKLEIVAEKKRQKLASSASTNPNESMTANSKAHPDMLSMSSITSNSTASSLEEFKRKIPFRQRKPILHSDDDHHDS